MTYFLSDRESSKHRFFACVVFIVYSTSINAMALETVPKDLRHLRACLLCSLVKVKCRVSNMNALASFCANM